MSAIVARRYYKRGRDALGRDDLEGALEALRSALELAPHSSSARISYAVCLARRGDTPRAAQTLRAGLGTRASAVSRAALWVTLGDILTASGDFLGAEDAFRQAASQSGFEARVASGLARVYGKLGRYPEAFAQLAIAGRALAEAERPTDHDTESAPRR
ncbi:tetratricopeptide repeat protein [Haliangium ochraceum]|uniref:Tetratricopeptide TPR_4 n=1 Tax=Haliangium ochraceum (strain DSM 14365 / JCM 11303 / SMP-2) TaxID=502025 RepID=D0LX81_HALO1|nr:tetratricopeptide repeat protein [Haliangium ochraceum]ACY16123.1 Tetratricopeptide TPR_4 [Haliangium ochraceum DSM 14365]